MSEDDFRILKEYLKHQEDEIRKTDAYSVYSEFDLNKHMKTFVNYLEVIIREDGKVEYAVPSHQEKLISILMNKNSWSREDIIEKSMEANQRFDFMEWLCLETGCISVWDTFIIGHPNIAQRKVLRTFIDNRILKCKLSEVLK